MDKICPEDPPTYEQSAVRIATIKAKPNCLRSADCCNAKGCLASYILQIILTAAMKLWSVLSLFFLFSAGFSSSVRSSSSCSVFSGADPAMQTCGNTNFLCPVDGQCKSRLQRCINSNICVQPQSGVEENCDELSNGRYNIRLGRTPLIKKKRDYDANYHELQHHFISYRGFVYEFGCKYSVQILDQNDPNFKYMDESAVTYEDIGDSICTYEETLQFTEEWKRKYNLISSNCQHFADLLCRYLQTAKCQSSSLEQHREYAKELIDGCTECCEADPTAGAATGGASTKDNAMFSATYIAAMMIMLCIAI